MSLDRIDLNSHGAFGQTIEAFDDMDLDGSAIVLIENRKATPSEYLERLFLQNILFNIDNRLVAISEFGIETTQPYFQGKPAEQSLIAEKFDEFGFEPHGALTWYSRGLEIAISDVAIRNIAKVDDTIFPFDIWARRIRLGEKDL